MHCTYMYSIISPLPSLGHVYCCKKGGEAYFREGTVIIPALVLFLPSNYTHMLSRSEINSTHGKNSRKCNIVITPVAQTNTNITCRSSLATFQRCHFAVLAFALVYSECGFKGKLIHSSGYLLTNM